MAGCGTGVRGWKCFAVIVVGFIVVAALFVSADEDVKTEASSVGTKSLYDTVRNFLWQEGRLGYTHVWPVIFRMVY